MPNSAPIPSVGDSAILKLRATQTAKDFIDSCQTDPKPHRVVIGAAVAGADLVHPSVLIVQRSAEERSYPNEWEIPGGHVDPGETVVEAVQREVFEETALDVTEVVSEFEGFHYWSTKYEGDESNDKQDTRLSICTFQLNFCVRVKDVSGIKLNPEEHQKHAWCTLETIDQFEMTSTMKKVVKDALVALENVQN
ncbi:hypothetical protein FB645_004933 [Coemansia sp. IMI 203386]|nr:hypothetical protein FB645_004933 [Coemansia sp. IMI 203386]